MSSVGGLFPSPTAVRDACWVYTVLEMDAVRCVTNYSLLLVVFMRPGMYNSSIPVPGIQVSTRYEVSSGSGLSCLRYYLLRIIRIGMLRANIPAVPDSAAVPLRPAKVGQE